MTSHRQLHISLAFLFIAIIIFSFPASPQKIKAVPQNCAQGGICTMTFQGNPVDVNIDPQTIQNFDFVVSTANGVGVNVGTPSIVNYVDPSVPVVLYDNFVERVEFNSAGCYNPWPQVNLPQNESWFLHDAQNQRIEHLYFTDFFEMNVNNQSYQDYTAQRALDLLNCAPGIDGYFYDQTSEYSKWVPLHINKSSCTLPCRDGSNQCTPQSCPIVECPQNCGPAILTQNQYETNGVFPILQRIKANLGSSRYLTVNGDYTGYTPYVDAQLYEGWIHPGSQSPLEFASKTSLITQLNWMTQSVFSNKRIFVSPGLARRRTDGGAFSTPEDVEKILNFTFASYIIAKRNDSYVYFNFDDRTTAQSHDYRPELFDLNLGLASGNYYIVGSGSSDVYIRDYQKGKNTKSKRRSTAKGLFN